MARSLRWCAVLVGIFALAPFAADANPTLELRDSNGGLIRSNDNWNDDPAQAAQVTAVGLQPKDNAESAIAAVLGPGAYTAIVAGKDADPTGVGVVEIYNLQ
jgi:hypothetical protein